MNWIEQYFGVTLDNGDGTTELMIIASLLAVLLAGLVKLYLIGRSNRQRLTPNAIGWARSGWGCSGARGDATS